MLRVLSQCDESSAFLFPGSSGRGAVAKESVSRAMQRVAAGYTLHGLRATFRTWGHGERRDFETCELILAHFVDSISTRTYARHHLLDPRREVPRDWADFSAG